MIQRCYHRQPAVRNATRAISKGFLARCFGNLAKLKYLEERMLLKQKLTHSRTNSRMSKAYVNQSCRHGDVINITGTKN